VVVSIPNVYLLGSRFQFRSGRPVIMKNFHCSVHFLQENVKIKSVMGSSKFLSTTKEVNVMVTLYACVLKIRGLNHGFVTGYHDCIFLFFSVFPDEFWAVTWNRPVVPPSKSLPTHNSSSFSSHLIRRYKTSEFETSSLNNLKINKSIPLIIRNYPAISHL